jgi:hypothetical protein
MLFLGYLCVIGEDGSCSECSEDQYITLIYKGNINHTLEVWRYYRACLQNLNEID